MGGLKFFSFGSKREVSEKVAITNGVTKAPPPTVGTTENIRELEGDAIDEAFSGTTTGTILKLKSILICYRFDIRCSWR
jgi:hypothetical protein